MSRVEGLWAAGRSSACRTSCARMFHNYKVEAMEAERNPDLVIKTVVADAASWELVREVLRLYGWDGVRESVLRDFRGLREPPESALRLGASVRQHVSEEFDNYIAKGTGVHPLLAD